MSLPSMTMKAVQLVSPDRPFALRAVSIPEPETGEVRVRIVACGVCRTDLHIQDGLLDLGKRDFTVGHEIAGVVDVCGKGVDQTWAGRKVVVYYYVGCGACRYCRVGDDHLCPQPKAQPGFSSDGGYAEYITIPVKNCVPVADHVDLAEAATMGCAGSTAVHAGRMAAIRPGDWVVISGAGGVGLALLHYARQVGGRVIAIGRGGARARIALEMGAEHIIDVLETPDAASRVRELTGEGADVVFELLGTQTAMSSALNMLRRRGRMVMLGYTTDSFQSHPIDFIVREITLLGSVGSTLDDLHEAIELLARGVMRSPVAEIMPLEFFDEALMKTRQGGLNGRIVLVP
ncbi:alcohol dehydrogenase catalytic domain-containing protein [Acetobacter sp.]|uniref:alcohol dehydrogenase catalytic domain-containing protein n=1 Tax=Acetobacter sp. TaxID=440 RepID=UPI0025B7EE5C|nr:alcohol dehydrogenase catalytic domain-containing protein [Acetobacter sp.]MCH4091636.1 alcohol dehydrogenase catalytic domain-containing protein [Acetobacter sp.]MCI1300946.1 alcohol dehydrogenase catalytic domain-containing protein [Acetobacter sp.]MCI1316177.1 alcohol dehydrogenase catalytic domain-containing protein [Acetobacter sp.]